MTRDQRRARAVLRAQSGDRDAMNALLVDLQERLYAYVHGLVRDPHLAEDVLQETFVSVCRNLAWLRDPAHFHAWVHRIASREAFRQLRRRQRHEDVRHEAELERSASAPASGWPSESLPLDAALVDRLPRLVASLSPASRAVLLLHYWEGLRLEEVADVLELSLGTVKSRLHYGLQALRRTLPRPTGGHPHGIPS